MFFCFHPFTFYYDYSVIVNRCFCNEGCYLGFSWATSLVHAVVFYFWYKHKQNNTRRAKHKAKKKKADEKVDKKGKTQWASSQCKQTYFSSGAITCPIHIYWIESMQHNQGGDSGWLLQYVSRLYTRGHPEDRNAEGPSWGPTLTRSRGSAQRMDKIPSPLPPHWAFSSAALWFAVIQKNPSLHFSLFHFRIFFFGSLFNLLIQQTPHFGFSGLSNILISQTAKQTC